MAEKQNPRDDVSSAPESGANRDDTSGSPSPDRGLPSGKPDSQQRQSPQKDDPSTAPEER
jgi:hypothetical protein